MTQCTSAAPGARLGCVRHVGLRSGSAVTGGEAVNGSGLRNERSRRRARQSRRISPRARSRRWAASGIGLGIRAGARRHRDWHRRNDQADVPRRAVRHVRAGRLSRPHIERMFEQLGIAAEMKAKALLEQGSVRAAEKVAAGEAEILLTLVSEILPVEGLALLGPLPDEFQSYISFAAAVGRAPRSCRGSLVLLSTCVAAPSAAPTFAAQGIER